MTKTALILAALGGSLLISAPASAQYYGYGPGLGAWRDNYAADVDRYRARKLGYAARRAAAYGDYGAADYYAHKARVYGRRSQIERRRAYYGY